MKLKYWLIQNKEDSQCYSIVAKTKKEALEKLKNSNNVNDFSENDIITVYKIEMEFDGVFDMFEEITGESGGRDQECYAVKQYSYNIKSLQ